MWTHPEVESHSLVLLTFDQLHVVPLADAPDTDVVAAIEAGDDIDVLLGSSTVAIDLIAIRQLKLDLLANAIKIEYVNGGISTSQLTVTFTTPEAADTCFTKIWRRLGDGFQLQPYARDAWSAARSPIVLLIGALLTTAVLALVLSVFEDMASARAAAQGTRTLPKSTLELLLGWMNWRWVCAVGGIVAAVAQVWLYRRLTRPPVALELLRN